ncbi:ABC transporter ATP-binding protein [Actinomyces viscosus]|uniref:Multidrug export ATP-binding/permease protein SAV1866 n=1 Tax=Actinomyces viscosus TaxID=1656 RepID=A0A3S4VI44_ACTVI|nr:ABC transporter ATP-binding protein [Actinomyces viscosus]TFH53547.1 ABC transporter ATP-binding protein [Actinomyces viscosus]VEI14571.1 Putative multidrug export ATP-binding/permease protein SAV1866 [Actinomyces viscosus]
MRQTLRLVGPDAAPQWRLMVGGTVVLLAEVFFRVLEPWPLKIVIDSLVAALGRHTGSAPATVPSLVGLGVALLVIVAGRAVCNYLATVAFALVGSRTAASLRSRAFHHVQGLSQQFHARNHSADTVQRLIADVNRMQEVAVTAGLPMAANTLTLLVMVVVMVFLDPLLAMIVVLAVVAFVVASSGNSRRISVASLRSRKSEGNLANTAQEALGAIKVVQAYGLEPLLHERFTGANTVSLSEGVRSRRIAARLERSTDVIVGVATAVVMVGGGIRVLGGAMSPGDLVLFTTYLRTTMKPLRDMAKYTGRIARATASGERVADMAVEPEIVSPHNAIVLDPVHGMIHFDHVRAAYERRQVLHGVSLTVVPGEHVALVGPSGSGKSTLASLVVRALDPTSGTVSLDGHSLDELDLRFLRSQVSVLHQEAVLLTGTIRENIRLGRPQALDEEVEAAARAAHAHDFITQMPNGYDTAVGERGGTLSGGQRQRIAIARALLRDSPIVILDEATTGLDPASTSAVLQAIDELVAGRTTLTITHDPQAAMRADRVVWIQDGLIRLEGSPQRLMDTSAEFRRWAASRLSDSFALEGSRA